VEEATRPGGFFVLIAYAVDPDRIEEHDRAYVAIYDYYRERCPEVRTARIYNQHYGSLIPGGRTGKLEILEFDSMEARAKYLAGVATNYPELPALWAAWRRTTVPGSIEMHVFGDHVRSAWVGPS
jgi:hypothetical protein